MRRTRILADGFCEIAGCERLPLPGTRRCTAHPAPVAAPSTVPDLFTTYVTVATDPPEAQERVREMHRVRPAAPDSFRDHPPSAPGSATSKAAAERMGASGRARTITERIHAHVIACGMAGATRAELSRDLPARLSTVCACVDTLKRQGLIGNNPGHTRTDPETHMTVEVLVDEAYVTRWRGVPRAARVQPPRPQPTRGTRGGRR